MKKTLNQCKQAIVGFCAMGIACTGMARTNYNVSEKQILDVMKTATRFMMETVSYKGGFVWNYLPDMSRSWGELEAKRTMVWIQPPGTPSVGHLLLDAYHATGDEYYYEAAQKVANALIWGQLECGGWNYVFDFAGENSLKEWYATVGRNAWRLEEFQHYYGNATYDDEGTMEAAKFLLRMYVEKNDPAYRQTQYGFSFLRGRGRTTAVSAAFPMQMLCSIPPRGILLHYYRSFPSTLCKTVP